MRKQNRLCERFRVTEEVGEDQNPKLSPDSSDPVLCSPGNLEALPAPSLLHSVPFLSLEFFPPGLAVWSAPWAVPAIVERSVCLHSSSDPADGLPTAFSPLFWDGSLPPQSFPPVDGDFSWIMCFCHLEFRGFILEVLPFFWVAADPYALVRCSAWALIHEGARVCACVQVLVCVLAMSQRGNGIYSSLFIPGGKYHIIIIM